MLVDLDFLVARRDGAVAAVALPHAEPSGASSQRLSATKVNPITMMSFSGHMVELTVAQKRRLAQAVDIK